MIKKRSEEITLPSFINKNFYFSYFKIININKLFVGVRNSKIGELEYLNIKKTPHYLFASNYLELSNISEGEDCKSYHDYIKSNPDDLRSKGKFESLINSIRENGYNFHESPILVFYTFKRPLPFGRWDVLDGFHRLAILAALGNKNIEVAILKRKQSIFKRLKQRIFDTN